MQLRDPATDVVLDTVYTFTTGPGDSTFHDTGWQPHVADLSTLGGRSVKLVFDETIPAQFSGPAQLELDSIHIGNKPPP